MRTMGVSSSGVTSLGPASLGSPVVGANTQAAGSNVVHLRPVDASDTIDLTNGATRSPLATSAASYLDEAPLADEALLHQAWDAPAPSIGLPTSTAAARERRRQVLLGLTGVALATLLLALFARGTWVAVHVLVDAVMLGYVILLVRHRQLAVDRMRKVEPIRPPVTEHAPVTLQAAPSYLVRSQTGS